MPHTEEEIEAYKDFTAYLIYILAGRSLILNYPTNPAVVWAKERQPDSEESPATKINKASRVLFGCDIIILDPRH